MDKIPIISLILYSFPESLIFISLGLALYGHPLKENLKGIVLYGLCATIITYYIRTLPLDFVSIVGLLLAAYSIITVATLRLSPVKSVIVILTGYVILFVAESTIAPVVCNLFGLTFEEVIKSPYLRIAIPWVHLSMLGLAAFILDRKKISLLPALNSLETKTPSSKMIFYLIGLILFQAMLGLIMYMAFFLKLYANSPYQYFSNLKWLSDTIGYLLIFLPIVSLFMISKLFSMVEKENIIAGQEAFIDNINNLFATIRAQRHDFLNHVQILDSYLKMSKLDEARKYMSDILEETKEINNIMVVNNPILNALIQAKMGIAHQFNIDFSLDIRTAMTDINIKSFELVKLLGNLINNAIEAVKDLDQENRRICLSIKEQDGHYIIEVFNPLPVIPPEMQDRIFKSGFTTKTSSENCGLGLTLVKNMTEKYNGSVSLNSTQAAGTTFTVMLQVVI